MSTPAPKPAGCDLDLLELRLGIGALNALADLTILLVKHGEAHHGESALNPEVRHEGLLRLHEIAAEHVLAHLDEADKSCSILLRENRRRREHAEKGFAQ